ncbi:MAG: hypothetical protein DCF30_19555 [Hyphomicrobiales bacterium]|nr:MAG: hypothetical protein DCF30_19555 [Hyphomicrobiales bacterium]
MIISKLKMHARIDDLVALRRLLPSNDFGCESALMTTKWFGYRFMSPVEAMNEFVRIYNVRLHRFLRFNADIEIAERVQGVRPGIPSKRSSVFTQLWRARQRADTLAVPYDILFDFGFEFASRRKRRWTPLPHQVFATETNHEVWCDKFVEFAEAHLDLYVRRLELPHYRMEHFRGLPAQEQFREVMNSELTFSLSTAVGFQARVAE